MSLMHIIMYNNSLVVDYQRKILQHESIITLIHLMTKILTWTQCWCSGREPPVFFCNLDLPGFGLSLTNHGQG